MGPPPCPPPCGFLNTQEQATLPPVGLSSEVRKGLALGGGRRYPCVSVSGGAGAETQPPPPPPGSCFQEALGVEVLSRDADSGRGCSRPLSQTRTPQETDSGVGGGTGGCLRSPRGSVGSLAATDPWLLGGGQQTLRGVCQGLKEAPVGASGRACAGWSSRWRWQGWRGCLGESRRHCLSSPPTSRTPGLTPGGGERERRRRECGGR